MKEFSLPPDELKETIAFDLYCLSVLGSACMCIVVPICSKTHTIQLHSRHLVQPVTM